MTLNHFDKIDGAFAVRGDEMRVHKGRSVVAVEVDGIPHYLKRYWLDWTQVFKRHVARGMHELRMIDWLNESGFAGPVIVRRGESRLGPIVTRLFFLMREVENEKPLEMTWRKPGVDHEALLKQLAAFAARLHDAGFTHTDFSERHILVGQSAGEFTFRLIDLERALVAPQTDHRRAAADLATLVASIADDELRQRVRDDVLADYIQQRRWNGDVDFRALFMAAEPTKVFY